MNWLECSDRMDQYVIKKDGTAVDVEYFMGHTCALSRS